jgi:hypothetical protein
MKPIKRGFKIWALADSYSGFLLNLDLYTGKKSNGIPEYGLGQWWPNYGPPSFNIWPAKEV